MSSRGLAKDHPAPLFRRSVLQLTQDLRELRISARALLDHYLERIEAVNPRLNAFVHVDAFAANAAEKSDVLLKAGRPRSLLEGIPIAVKDNLWVWRSPAVWGSPLFAGHIADADELPVARLRSKGAVFLGKTNVPEFAMRGYTGNPVHGVTRNPWNPARTPGGSSGGAAAAVAAGLAPLALATDGGGSIRRPAAHTGLVGLKPTVGRIRRGGGFPQLTFDCEVVGPIGRTVEDTQVMFEALVQGPRIHQVPRRANILFVERFDDAPVAHEIVESCREAASRLSALGHNVVADTLPFSIDAVMFAWQAASSIGLSLLARREPKFFELTSSDFAEQAQAGQNLLSADYAEHIETLLAFRTTVAQAFDHIDIILTPATAAQPWPAEELYPGMIDGQLVGPRGHAVFTGWVNACGCPAIAVPASPDAQGMPIGFQLVGPIGSDELLLQIASEYEAAHPFGDRWPALALDAL